MELYLKVFKQFGNFEGRTGRREFWTFALINAALLLILILFFQTLACLVIDSDVIYDIGSYVIYLFLAVTVTPSITVRVRRLHDIGKGGSMLFLIFIPVIGTIWFLLLMLTKGNNGANKYGADPKEEEATL